MTAPNLASLLNTRASDVKRPVALPDGTFYGIIKSHEFVQSSQKKTPGIQYNIGLTLAHEDVDLSDFQEAGGVLTEKTMRTTFWLSEGALFMFTDFLASLGIEPGDRTLGELAPLPVGQPVILDVVAKPNKAGDGFYNEISKVKGASAES